MQVKNDDDLHGGQRSSEVKCGKLCYQTWSEEQLMEGHSMPTHRMVAENAADPFRSPCQFTVR